MFVRNLRVHVKIVQMFAIIFFYLEHENDIGMFSLLLCLKLIVI